MTEQTTFGAETSRWPDTRQNWAITTPPGPGVLNVSPSAPPSGWPLLNSTSLPGLQSLIPLDKVFIDQQLDTLEAITGWPTNNKYVVMDEAGRLMFYLEENSSMLTRFFWGKRRSLEVKLFDRSNQEVLHMRRPSYWWWSHVEIYAGNTYLGKVTEKFSWLYSEFDIHDDNGKVVFQISGDCCKCICSASEEYKVYSADASRQIGVITKEWGGLIREIFTNVDIFGISFPTSIDVKLKALLLGAAVLIDFVHFEEDRG